MKKLLLLIVIAFSVCNVFAQAIVCPTDKKRNNGNNCATGGITFLFAAQPPANLYVKEIREINPDFSATTVTGAAVYGTQGNVFTVSFCFINTNLDPAASLAVDLFIDVPPLQAYNGEAITTCFIPGSGPLPVVLGNFNAINKNGKVSLTWETFQEVENDGFEIQRRVGTGKYETVAFVDSKVIGGTGAGTTYSFDENAPLAKGVTYYRLRQVDFNGQAAYSEVKALRGLGSPIAVFVYPNPSRGATNVAIPAGSGIMDISLNDFAGKSVQSWNGINISNLQLSNLKPGIYMLRISFRETGEQLTERIVVQ